MKCMSQSRRGSFCPVNTKPPSGRHGPGRPNVSGGWRAAAAAAVVRRAGPHRRHLHAVACAELRRGGHLQGRYFTKYITL